MNTKKNKNKRPIYLDTIYTPDIQRIDPNSIKTTTLFSFIVFGAILIIILWALTSFFINTYYSSIRSREAIGIANNIEEQFRQSPVGFEHYAIQAAESNGIYIRLDGPDAQALIYDGTTGINDETLETDVADIRQRLIKSPDSFISKTIKDNVSNSNSRLIYASIISGWEMESILYIIAPLYPDHATINIIRNMLLYISIIVLIIAIILAYYLSNRLSKPITNITKSAQELSGGNYNVKFNGANFTETKELAKALNKASYEMEKTDFYQREILANVSHDLKTPLTMIRGYAEKIIDITGDKPEKRNHDLNVIISETERLNNLVTDIMTVSNLQSHNIELNKETFDFVEAAKEVYDSFVILNSTEDFEINFNPCKKAFVNGDRTKIMQVMTNFVSNAVKYSGDNKFVDIRLKRVGRKIAFHCIDHGIGIPSEDLSHVWDRYYRTSANHERDIEGSGLGLSIVKGILTLHNASYGVNSEEGKGSDFWFEMDIEKRTAGIKNE